MTDYDFIKEGARVRIKTEKELWKTYPSRYMPYSLTSEMKELLGTTQTVDCVSIVNRDAYKLTVTICGWSWPEGALLSCTTPKGNTI